MERRTHRTNDGILTVIVRPLAGAVGPWFLRYRRFLPILVASLVFLCVSYERGKNQEERDTMTPFRD